MWFLGFFWLFFLCCEKDRDVFLLCELFNIIMEMVKGILEVIFIYFKNLVCFVFVYKILINFMVWFETYEK